MREIYRAPTVKAAETRFAEFAGEWQQLYPAMIQAWRSVWTEFVPFLEFPAELHKLVYTTNAIESLNTRFRRAVRHRGHFPNQQSALKGALRCGHPAAQEPLIPDHLGAHPSTAQSGMRCNCDPLAP